MPIEKINLFGDKELRRKLQKLGDQTRDEILTVAMTQVVIKMQERIPRYPDKRGRGLGGGVGATARSVQAAGGYARTGTLGRLITTFAGMGGRDLGGEGGTMSPAQLSGEGISGVVKRSKEVIGRIGLRLQYAPKVIDENRQEGIFKGFGWWTLQQIVRDNKQIIEDESNKALRNALKRAGFGS